MNILLPDIAKQYLRVKRLGWLPAFKEAAQDVSFILDTADLLAIASRESNLDPRWLTTAGDRGNGYGLLQADKRYFPEWVKSGKWRDAAEGIHKGADILSQKWADLQDCIGNKRGVKSSKTGKTSYFVGKDVKGLEAKRVLIASYNCGRWAHYAVSNGQDADTYSTGKDYSADVVERAQAFRILLGKDSTAAQADIPKENQPDTNQSVVLEQPAEIVPPSKSFDWSVINRVFIRITDAATGTLDRITQFEGSLSKSRFSASVLRSLAIIFAFFAHYWPYILAAAVLVVLCEWFMRRTDK